MDIIYKILEKNILIPNYIKLLNQNTKNYVRSSNIYPALRCLHSFQCFNALILKNANLYENNIDN